MRASAGRPGHWKQSLLVVVALLLSSDAAWAEAAPVAAAPKLLLAQAPRRGRPTGPTVPIWIWVVGGVIGGGSILLLAAVLTGGGKKKKASAANNAGEGGPGSAFAAELVGQYRLVNLLQTGQSSQVWESVHISSNLHFAIKILLPEHAQDKDQRQFLFHEAEVAMQLQHPNVIRVIAMDKDPKHPHFVMEFFPGGSLKGRVMHKETAWIREKAQDILKQTATALAFINAKGWVHRDIKPDNVLVNSAGEVRVIDFAIAQPVSTGAMSRMLKGKGPVQGTRSYMSPEQIRNEALDGRADVYSFGAMAYELVTGRPPFRAASAQELLNKHVYEKPVTPRTHNPDVTEEFASMLLKMLAKKREERPTNFHEVLMELKKIRVFKVDAPKKSGAT